MPAISVAETELQQARILLVDDQPANLQLLEQMLASTGYTCVRSTPRPREVLELHREHEFDLIVLDLQMPGMDGFEVMEQLRTLDRDPYLPVLVLTAQPSQKLRALQAGARDFVGKPFELVELQTRIRNMLEVRLLHRRLAAHNEQLEQAVRERTAELRESEARFRRLVELATDWYWEQDAEGNFTRVSGPALEMLGMAGAETAEAGAWVADAQAALGQKLATRSPFLDFVYRRVLPDGSEQVLQASGEPSFDEAGRFRGYRGIGTDVTAREAAVGAPAMAQRFRAALEDGGPAIVLRDANSLRIVDANRAACRLAGSTREQLLAADPGALDSGDAASLRADIARLRAAGAPLLSRIRLTGAGGEPVEIDRLRNLDPDGGVVVDVLHPPVATAR